MWECLCAEASCPLKIVQVSKIRALPCKIVILVYYWPFSEVLLEVTPVSCELSNGRNLLVQDATYSMQDNMHFFKNIPE